MLKNKIILISSIIGIVALSGLFCSESEAKDCEVKWVSVSEVTKSLEGKKPMNVGFDVDDTVLFSSPAFYYGSVKYSPKERMKFLTMPEFWLDMNNNLDRFSLPKITARRLIEFHKARGDNIFFITARPASKTESLTPLLAGTFSIEKMNKVIFTGESKTKNPKTQPILDNKIQVFYGDSDVDIQASQQAKIRGIRLLRAENSLDKPFPKVGCMGEEVIQGSGK